MAHAIHVLSQLAHASILRRLRERNEIPDANWRYRMTQPMHFFGPFNIRPFLNREWLSRGGVAEVITTGPVYQCSLPIMPTEEPDKSGQGVLMTKERFFHRCLECKRQINASIRHPLVREFAEFTGLRHREERYRCAMGWRSMEKTGRLSAPEGSAVNEDGAEGGMTMGDGSFIISNMVSSLSTVSPNGAL